MAPIILGMLLVTAQPPERPMGPAEEVRLALDAPGVVVTPNPMSFVEFASFFKTRSKVHVRLDMASLPHLDVSEAMFSVSSRDGSYRDALRQALRPHDLRFGIVGSEVWVSTADGLAQRQLRQPVSVDIKKESITQVIKTLAAQTGANLLVDPRVDERLIAERHYVAELRLDDVPLEVVVRLAAELAALQAVRLDNVIFITTPERATRLQTPTANAAGDVLQKEVPAQKPTERIER